MISSGEAEPSPPARLKYASRSDDGSGYNPLFPSMGKAGEPYARSVPSLHYTPAQNLPDPGLVFDTLLKRDKFVPHPSGISSVSITSLEEVHF
jgi:linoleate 10R-lipoxygenase